MSKTPTEKQALPEIKDLIADFLGMSPEKVHDRAASRKDNVDFFLKAKNYKFLIEYRRTASAESVAGAAEQLQAHKNAVNDNGIPLLVVPFMGNVGREICDKAAISWLDLSGNAKISAPNLRIWIEGRPNEYVRRGRPTNLFAPKSSRIARQLLLVWDRYQSQADLVRATDLDDGYVSKIVRRLVDEELVTENDEGEIRLKNPTLLLDAWRSSYDFTRHRIIKGHITARTGEDLVKRLARKLKQREVDYAATGLGAAWLYTHFASHRIATFYLRSRPSQSLLKDVDFWGEEKGANTWFVVPNDEGVFQGAKTAEGINCASEVQVFLDLKDHPERSKEAAEELRKSCLTWEMDD